MPRTKPDVGIKPFEFRTGIGGLPPLAGMYRAGDPATIPPHKFHLLVNMRIQPSGLVTRPGLKVEYNTGVEECIDGITGWDDLSGSLFLWPGNVKVDPGPPLYNAATFRAIWAPFTLAVPPSYSEYVYVRAEEINVSGAVTKMVDFDGTLWGDAPFTYNSQLCSIQILGSAAYAIVSLEFPLAANIAAGDCYRLTLPAAPCDPADPWPNGYPTGMARRIFELVNPFGTGAYTILQVVARPERSDGPLGEPGVRDKLWLLCNRTSDNTVKVVLYDGINQTTQYTSPAGLVQPILGFDRVGPYVLALGTGGAPVAAGWSASRDEGGSWVVGLGIAIGAAVPMPLYVPYIRTRLVDPALEFGGFGAVLGEDFNIDASCVDAFVVRREEAVVGVKKVAGWQRNRLHCYVAGPHTAAVPPAGIIGWATLNTTLWVLIADASDDGGGYFLKTYDWPTILAAAPDANVAALATITLELGTTTGYLGKYWLSTVGNRVFLGGGPFQTAIAGFTPVHGVFDVTIMGSPFCVHNGPATGDTLTNISRGALPIPGQAAGEGFGTADPQFVGGF